MKTKKSKTKPVTTMKSGTSPQLAELREMQKRFMQVLGIPTQAVETSDILESRTIADATQGILLESSEILNELTIRSKPWKYKTPDQIHSDMAMELIDVFFYFLELSILLGIEGVDLEDLYFSKLKKNLHRVIGSSASEDQVNAAKKLLTELA